MGIIEVWASLINSGLKTIIETGYNDSLLFMKRVYDNGGLSEVGSLDFNNYLDDGDYNILFFFDYHEFFGIQLTPEYDEFRLSPLTVIDGLYTDVETTECERVEFEKILGWIEKLRLNPVL